MKKYIEIIFSLAVLSIIMIGCSEDQITKLPVTSLFDDQFWTSETEVMQATNAAYFDLENVDQIQWDALTEVLFSQWGQVSQISTGGLNPGASLVNGLWTGAYAVIRYANWFLNNVDKSGLDEAKLAKYKGQWRFIRAWAHYKLMYQFSDVPIVTVVLDIDQGKVNQDSRADVLSFVLDELDQTITELSSSDYNPERGMITSWAAKALKARILLYEGTLASNNTYLQESADLADNIINGPFQLHDNYTELFRPEGDDSDEIILARINPDMEGQYHSLGQWLGPISFHASWNIFSPTMALVDRYPDINGESITTSALYDPANPFDNRDPRLTQTIFDWTQDVDYEGASFINGGTWLNMRKFIDPSEQAEQRSHNDHIIFRLGEMYLIYVEAMNEIGGPTQELVDMINDLRVRGGQGAASDGSDITVNPILLAGLNQDSFRDIVRNERIIEMVGEGLLYYDYHRWRLLETTMNQPAVGVVNLENRLFTAPRDYLWPIPDWELVNNENFEQNTGWGN